jgi:two-component system chemotaxis response regulator CheB
MSQIRVLIVDDSATAREVIREILSQHKDIEIVGMAPDAYVARDLVVKLKPDVITLDVEMPRMDGVAFLRKLMKHMPTPVVMVSSLTRKGAKITLDALEAGAIDFVEKPHSYIHDHGGAIAAELVSKVRIASKAKLLARIATPTITHANINALAETTKKVIVIGASTGGTQALTELLKRFPRNSPGVLVVQHMPGSFTGSFAERLNQVCAVDVKEAQNNDRIQIGQVLIAPGDYHMVLRRSGGNYFVQIGDGKNVSGHKPSVDVLFNSAAKSAGANALGIILTGMGGDGAKGMKNMHDNGAKTIAQNEETCIVFGMPKVAISLGGVDHILPLDKIADKALALI